MFQYFFAGFWVCGGLILLTVGFIVIGYSDMPAMVAALWIFMSMIPILVGCCFCICFCLNTKSCCCGTSLSSEKDETELVSFQQPHTPNHLQHEVETRVIVLFHSFFAAVSLIDTFIG